MATNLIKGRRAALALLAAGALGWAFWPRSEREPPEPRHLPLTPGITQPGPLRLTVFGTSLTQSAIWPAALAQHLQCLTGDAVTLTRIAAPGRGSDWALSALPRVLASKADVIVMEFAINDADVTDGISRAASLENHRRIIKTLRQAVPEPRIVLMTTNPAFGSRGWVRPRLGSYYGQVRDLARTEQTGLLDTYPLWQHALATSLTRHEVLPDGLHPRPETENALVVQAFDQVFGRCASGG